MSSASWLKDVFCIPHCGQYLVYLPLERLVFSANSSLVNLLCAAGRGEQAALRQLELTPGLLAGLAERGEALREKMQQRVIPPFAPCSVSLFLTNRCTMQCGYCYARGGERTDDMDWETVTGVLSAVSRNVNRIPRARMIVHFHGGGDVSACWPLLTRARAYLDSLPLARKPLTTVATNGFLDRAQQQWIIANFNSATVSLDGLPEIQNVQRPLAGGGVSFPFVDNTLRAFDRAGFSYGIRMTVSSSSVEKLAESVAFICANYGARAVKAEPLFPQGRALSSTLTPPDAADFVAHFRKARKIALDAGRRLTYSGARPKLLTPVFCQAAGGSCAVTPVGLVTSCYEVLSPDDPLMDTFCYGRFDRERGDFVIDEEKRAALYGLTVFGRSECALCFCKYHCAGDCPVKASSAGRTPDRCYITRELTLDYLAASLRRAGEEKKERVL